MTRKGGGEGQQPRTKNAGTNAQRVREPGIEAEGTAHKPGERCWGWTDPPLPSRAQTGARTPHHPWEESGGGVSAACPPPHPPEATEKRDPARKRKKYTTLPVRAGCPRKKKEDENEKK